MTYQRKFLKYRTKIYNLNINLNKNVLKGGERYIVIPNNGQIEGMTNQCLWISIKDYLQNVLGNNITVRQLRQQAGLDASTENKMFDFDTPEFRSAIERISSIYGLEINFFEVTRDGTHVRDMHIIGDDNPFIVSIAFYGAHFQLITSGPGIIALELIRNDVHQEPEIPGFFFKKEQKYIPITEATDENSEIMKTYLELIDKKQILDLFIQKINKYKIKIDNLQKDIKKLNYDLRINRNKPSNDLQYAINDSISSEIKIKHLRIIQLTNKIDDFAKKIDVLQKEIDSLTTILSILENE
jgi:hypothetical protein